MASKLELILEAERRGLPIPEDKRILLAEARTRGIVPPMQASQSQAQPQSKGRLHDLFSQIADEMSGMRPMERALGATNPVLGALSGLARTTGVGGADDMAAGAAKGLVRRKATGKENVAETVGRGVGKAAPGVAAGLALAPITGGMSLPVVLGAEAAASLGTEAAVQALGSATGGEDISGQDLAIAGLVPPAVGAGMKAVSKAGTAIASNMDEAAQAAKALADKFKIPLTWAEMLNSRPMAQLEGLLERSPFSSGVMQNFRQLRAQTLIEQKDNFLRMFGVSRGRTEVGDQVLDKAGRAIAVAEQKRVGSEAAAGLANRAARDAIAGERVSAGAVGKSAQESLAERSSEVYERAKGLYAKARASVRPEIDSLSGVELIDEARAILKEYEKTPSALEAKTRAVLKEISDGRVAGAQAELAGLAQEITDGASGFAPRGDFEQIAGGMTFKPGSQWTFAQMDKWRSLMGRLATQTDAAMGSAQRGIRGQSSEDAGVFKRLGNAADQAMSNFAEYHGGDVKKNLEIARAFYRKDFKDVFGQKVAAIRAVTNKYPEDIYTSIVKAGDVSDIQALKKAIGPEAFGKFQRRFVQDMVGEIGDDVPLPEQILSRLSKYGKDTLREMLPAEQIHQLKTFAASGKMPQFIESQAEKSLRVLLKKKPSRAFDFILTADPKDALRYKQFMGPELAGQFRRYMVEDVLGPEAAIKTPAAIARRLSTVGDETLGVWFGKEEIKQMREIGQVSQLMRGMERLAGNPSGTGDAVISAGEMGMVINSALTGKLVKAAGFSMGKMGLANLYLSETGRRLLTTGLKMKANDPAARGLVSAIVRVASESTSGN